MYIQVQLLNGFSELLWYSQPIDWPKGDLRGSIVRVPLRNQQIPALIVGQQQRKPEVSFELRAALAIEPVPQDHFYQKYIEQVSAYYQVSPFILIRRLKQFLFQKEAAVLTNQKPPLNNLEKVTLTAAQQHIVDAIAPSITNPTFDPVLLHGVTGSGKTEVYKELIKKTIADKKTVLLLLPEVTLAIAFKERLEREFAGTIPLFSFHSATAPREKRLLWQELLAHKPVLIIGVHLPILLPIANLGLIIIDEEHDTGYQEKKHPKINSKDIALLRARIAHIPILLGSATPSVTTLYQVKQQQWRFFQLKERFGGAFPTIQTVGLLNGKERQQFWISNELRDAIKDRIAKKEQTIIFLNRRGHSFFVQCKKCSLIFQCPACSVSLTLHTNSVMNCHYCDYATKEPTACPSCHGSEFLRKGIGTQQAVALFEKLFPTARIARADLDTTKKKKEWQATVAAMEQGTIDILVGTQTITKGYHFPHVTLVGILWADLNLHFPIYSAAEQTLQQLIQVAGRAGRQSMESSVIVQHMDDHPIFSFLNEIDYLAFYKEEITKRAMVGYPPSKRLAEIELKNTHEPNIEKESHDVAALLHTMQQRLQLDIQILGPAKPPVHKIKNWYSRKIYLKGNSFKDIITLYKQVRQLVCSSAIYFTPNPNQ